MLTIESRYCGPKSSGNGGYVAGRFAALVTDSGPVSVMLRQPPPLETPLSVLRDGDGVLRLMDGERLIAEAAIGPAYDGPLPEAVSLEVARAAEQRYGGLERHPFPWCCSCGPDNPDGLQLKPGPTGITFGVADLVATVWTPTPEQTGPEFAWVALDCPGAWAAELGPGRPSVLGRITAQVTGEIVAGVDYIVLGWKTGESGRKSFVNTAIYGPDNSVIALASATWISVDPSSLAVLNS